MQTVIDSAYTLDEALAGKDVPEEVRRSLVLVEVAYASFDGRVHAGQLVLHERVAEEARAIFADLFARAFPIEKVVPVVAYGWDDDASMRANNSSAFNYRFIAGTNELSDHAFGLAIDINPMQNPYTKRGGRIVPDGATYHPAVPGTIAAEVAALFTERGWEWGGAWDGARKDWQHFAKRL